MQYIQQGGGLVPFLSLQFDDSMMERETGQLNTKINILVGVGSKFTNGSYLQMMKNGIMKKAKLGWKF